jgi:S1-C subfamily serine protease
MLRFIVGLACLVTLTAADRAVAQPPAGSPRRTRQVEIIEQSGASVVAIFSQAKDNTINSGSGSVIHPDGYILTNDHVVLDRPGVVLHRDHPPLLYRAIGRLWEKDLALIKVDAPKPLVSVPLGRSHDLLAGEPILIGGNPGGRGIVFSAGIVSSPRVMLGAPSALVMTNFPDDSRDRYIQFDAASNPGNSGGPMINADGRQIGVVVAKNLQEQAINFAIPIDRVHQSLGDLVLPEARGDFWTGIDLDVGATTIRVVAEKSPAAEAGLRSGDAITALGEGSVTSGIDYLVGLVGRKSGETVAVKYLRGGKPGEAALKLGAYPVTVGRPQGDRKPGLRYRLYHGRFTKCPEFEKLKPAAVGTVLSHRLNNVPNLPDDGYALLLDGYLEIPETGVWSLAIGSDDGSRLIMDGKLIADNDGPHPVQFTSVRGRFEKGLHPVRIEFFEATGDADLQVTLVRDGGAVTQEPRYYFDAEKK